MRVHRRDFLKSSLAASTLVSMGAMTVPSFLGRSAVAAAGGGGGNDRILVVVQLVGGNDGLNTVIPHGMDGYAKGRRALRLPDRQILTINDEIGLHPSMRGLADLLEQGRLAIAQGVGYPNPDRSHFRSMEIWETARPDDKTLATGWLGRLIDAAPAPTDAATPALHVGARALPLALRARRAETPSLESLEQYRLQLGGDAADARDRREVLDGLARIERPQDDPLLGFLTRSTLTAYSSSRRLESLSESTSGPTDYPNFGLARRLELIARVIKAGFGTRIYYTTLDGFDTHANQLGAHAALLGELSASLAAFEADLAAAGQGDRVAVLSFSEFGRRVAENASLGTDHGAAAPVFVIGPIARAGLFGPHPRFDDLEDGDLRHHTDFRRVYATLLESWLGCPAAPIVGEGFRPLDLFANQDA